VQSAVELLAHGEDGPPGPALRFKSPASARDYQVPSRCRNGCPPRSALRGLSSTSRVAAGKGMGEKISAEYPSTPSNSMSAPSIARRCDRMAQAQQAFAHYSVIGDGYLTQEPAIASTASGHRMHGPTIDAGILPTTDRILDYTDLAASQYVGEVHVISVCDED